MDDRPAFTIEFKVVWWRWALLQVCWTFLECLLEMAKLCAPFLTNEGVVNLCVFFHRYWDDARWAIQPLWHRYDGGEWTPVELE